VESLLGAEIEETPFAVAIDDALGGLVNGLASVARSEARFTAFKVEQVYQLSRFAELNVEVTTSHGMRPWSHAATARRTAISEVALALRIPERSAQSLIEESRMLVERLPLTMAGLRAGDFSYRHAKSIVRFSSNRRGTGWAGCMSIRPRRAGSPLTTGPGRWLVLCRVPTKPAP
jgi:hypothetical protein